MSLELGGNVLTHADSAHILTLQLITLSKHQPVQRSAHKPNILKSPVLTVGIHTVD